MEPVRPQPEPAPGAKVGCLLPIAVVALVIGSLLAAVYGVLATELGGIDGPVWAVGAFVVAVALAGAAVLVSVRGVRRRR